MNFLFFLFCMLLSKIRNIDYAKIKLVYELENYYIPIKISQKSD